MSCYKVIVDDNAHYMDEDERYEYGVFSTAEEAIAVCKSLVDVDLEIWGKKGMTADALYQMYVGFGVDPFIVPIDKDDKAVDFSAWEYAMERSQILGSKDSKR